MPTKKLRDILESEFWATDWYDREEFVIQLLDAIGVEAKIIEIPDIED